MTSRHPQPESNLMIAQQSINTETKYEEERKTVHKVNSLPAINQLSKNLEKPIFLYHRISSLLLNLVCSVNVIQCIRREL